MFGVKYEPVDPAFLLADAAEDHKKAKRVGQYKISPQAIYQPDGKYLLLSAVTSAGVDQTSVHVTGC